MNTKSKATVATIGLGALVLSGGTLALWQDNAELNNTTIDTGRLSVEAGEQSVYDISEYKLSDTHDGELTRAMELAERTKPDLINLDDYKASPGDTLRVVQPITVDLEGHNLLARLDITDTQGDSILNVVGGDDVDEFSITRAWLVTAETAQNAAVLDNAYSTPWEQVEVEDDYEFRFTEADNDARLYVVYDVSFYINDQVDSDGGKPDPADTDPDIAAMDAKAAISGLKVTLTQIRHADEETVEP